MDWLLPANFNAQLNDTYRTPKNQEPYAIYQIFLEYHHTRKLKENDILTFSLQMQGLLMLATGKFQIYGTPEMLLVNNTILVDSYISAPILPREYKRVNKIIRGEGYICI